MTGLRVLLVDDSVTVRRLIPQLLGTSERIEEVDTASGGSQALRMTSRSKFDLVILDQEMPEMDGLETLRRLQSQSPQLPVVMFSSLTERGASLTLDALSQGARSYVTKPAGMASTQSALDATRQGLLDAILPLFPRNLGASSATESAIRRREPQKDGCPDCVVIAASTGGPNVVKELVSALPEDLAVPVLIAQHMPPVFTTMFAARLNHASRRSVREAFDGAALDAGTIWVAPGDYHLVVRGRGILETRQLHLHQEPRLHGCRPSADVLFSSVASQFTSPLAVVVSGMGQDGLEGTRAIVEAGGACLAQDAATSVVWSMPGAVAKAGLTEAVLDPRALSQEIVRRVRLPKERARSRAVP